MIVELHAFDIEERSPSWINVSESAVQHINLVHRAPSMSSESKFVPFSNRSLPSISKT